MNKKITSEVLTLVVSECRNGCTDARSAYAYIERHRPQWIDKDSAVEGYALMAFLESLNFFAIREHSDTLSKIVAQESL